MNNQVDIGREWVRENGPGGWIDNLRKDLFTAKATIARQQRAIEDIHEQAIGLERIVHKYTGNGGEV